MMGWRPRPVGFNPAWFILLSKKQPEKRASLESVCPEQLEELTVEFVALPLFILDIGAAGIENAE
jgi:hypothetical protein